MCGICGVWSTGRPWGVSGATWSSRMRDTMPHTAGLDDVGADIFDGGRLRLGFRRLSISVTSLARRSPADDGLPKARACGSSSTAGYNHAELRARLEQRGPSQLAH